MRTMSETVKSVGELPRSAANNGDGAMKTFTLMLVAGALSGCASEVVATKSSLGGAFPLSAGMTADLAQKNTDAQCAQHGKRGRVTSLEAKGPGQVLFECK